MNKKVLVLAGAGLLGRTIIERLSKENCSVSCVDLAEGDISGVNYMKLNLLDSEGINFMNLISDFDIIINCAGQITNPINTCLRLNSEFIINLTKQIKQTDKILFHISSVTIYGSVDFADENTLCNPETPYSTCKAVAENIIKTNLSPHQFCIIRLSNLYGSGQMKGIMGYLLKSLKEKKHNLFFNNNGSLVRYYIHVNDAAAAIVKLVLFSNSGIYNLIGKDRFTILELISTVEKIAGVKFTVNYSNDLPYDNSINITDQKISNVSPQYNYDLMSYLKIEIESTNSLC